MRLQITRRQHNDSFFSYNDRVYVTEDENLIYEYLNVDADKNISTREWIEENLIFFICSGNSMSLGYNKDDCHNVDYYVLFDNGDKIFESKY